MLFFLCVCAVQHIKCKLQCVLLTMSVNSIDSQLFGFHAKLIYSIFLMYSVCSMLISICLNVVSVLIFSFWHVWMYALVVSFPILISLCTQIPIDFIHIFASKCSFGWFVMEWNCSVFVCVVNAIWCIYIWFSMSVFHDFQRALSRLCALLTDTTNGNNHVFWFHVDSILLVHSMWNTANGHFMSWTCKLCHDTYNKMKVTLK